MPDTHEPASHDAYSQQILATTLRSIGDAVIATDRDGCITFMNSTAEQLTGWLEHEAQGRPCADVFRITNKQTGLVVESPVDRVIREGVVVGLANHTLLTARDGTMRPIDDSGAPIRDLNGDLFGVVLVFRDVTEQAKSAEVRERLAAIVESSHDAVISKDLDGIVTSWNPAAQRLYGYTAEEAIGQSKTIIIPRSQPDELPNILRRIRNGERIEHYETKRVRKDGTVLDVSISVSPVRDVDGYIIGASTIARDITSQKRDELRREFLQQASEVLGSSLEFQETLQTVTKLAVPKLADWCAVDILDEDGAIRQLAIAHVDPDKIKWAHELRAKYPPDPNALTGLPNVLRTAKTEFYPIIPEEMLLREDLDAERLEIIRQIGFVSAMIVPMIARGRVIGAITCVTTKESGQHYTVEDRMLAESLAARSAIAIDNARLYRAAQQEIIHRKEMEQAIHASEERLRAIIDNTPSVIYMKDVEGRYVLINRAFERLNGKCLAEVRGKTDLELFPSDLAEPIAANDRRVLETGEAIEFEEDGPYTDRAMTYMSTKFPLHDAEGKVYAVCGISTDITDRKQREAAIEVLNARLKRAMAETHHRVKNNLQVISALVDVQVADAGETIQTEALRRVGQHVQALATMHDLLTRKASESGEVEYLHTRDALTKLRPLLQSIVVGRPIRFDIEDIRLPIRQGTSLAVLINELVSNAVKHGEGEIELSLCVVANHGRLQIRDQGPGFSVDFDPNTAAHTGLELVQSLSRWDLGGEPTFENHPEGGARVTVTFPIKDS